MNETELYQTALIKVQGGQTIAAMIIDLYKKRWAYQLSTTEYQRAMISRARAEYLQRQQDKTRNKYPRLFVETTAERRKAVEDHCKAQGISIARFVNSAIAEALFAAKKDS